MNILSRRNKCKPCFTSPSAQYRVGQSPLRDRLPFRLSKIQNLSFVAEGEVGSSIAPSSRQPSALFLTPSQKLPPLR